jgi:HKD family nuclease
MQDTTISFVNQALPTLLQAGKDYPQADLDFSVAYISAIGVSWLRPLMKTAHRVRVVAGLCPLNRVNAFLELQDLGAEVYVFVAEPRKIFHPKIYYGATNAQAWVMIGSSNLTGKGLSYNVERNLFVAGPRLTGPFTSIEAELESFRTQSYPFTDEIARKLTSIERKTPQYLSEDEYLEKLIDVGIKPKAKIVTTIPSEVEQLALETMLEFAETTPLVHAYQMLLLLILLSRVDQNGQLSLEEAAYCFSQFYTLRTNAGLPREKARGSKIAEVNKSDLSRSKMARIIKIDPFPRFERRGLLDLSEDEQHFIVNPALLAALTPQYREQLRTLAIRRLAEHFGEDQSAIEALVITAIG